MLRHSFTHFLLRVAIVELITFASYGGMQAQDYPSEGESMTTETTVASEPTDVLLDIPPVIVSPYRSWIPSWFAMRPATRPITLGKAFRPMAMLPEIPTLKRSALPHQTTDMDLMIAGMELDEVLFCELLTRHTHLFEETYKDLSASLISAELVEAGSISVEGVAPPPVMEQDPMKGLRKFMAPKKYWTPSWNSVVQFSQNYISDNWHKGGSSNLNLFSRQLFKMNYKRDKLTWHSDFEWRLSIFTSPSDTIGRYRVADDLIRLHSNLGVEAAKNLFYTLDAEARTQAFTMREENKPNPLSGLLSPIIVNVGLGMKYVYNYKSSTHYGRKFHLEINIAPLAYDFRWAGNKKIDLNRHGFKSGQKIYSAVGSMLKADIIWDITQNVKWQSRLFYNTSYKRIEAEWENALSFSLSKYFSTRLNARLRFDDAAFVGQPFFKKLQVNQLFSLGFEMTL